MPVDPAPLHIVYFPAAILRRRADVVPRADDDTRRVAQRMIELMFEAEGIGLAAPQVGLPWRMFVVHVPPSEDRPLEAEPAVATSSPLVFIDPVLSDPVGAPEGYDEGCLSLPEITGEVLRPPVITVTASDLEGRRFSRTATGLLGRCLQHEYDHIEGVLILDRMTQISRLKNRAAVKRLEREANL
jgi:peptide deformylase